jgi:hypothetical protein
MGLETQVMNLENDLKSERRRGDSLTEQKVLTVKFIVSLYYFTFACCSGFWETGIHYYYNKIIKRQQHAKTVFDVSTTTMFDKVKKKFATWSY